MKKLVLGYADNRLFWNHFWIPHSVFQTATISSLSLLSTLKKSMNNLYQFICCYDKAKASYCSMHYDPFYILSCWEIKITISRQEIQKQLSLYLITYTIVMSLSWNYPSWAEPSCKVSEPSWAKLGYFNYRAETNV